MIEKGKKLAQERGLYDPSEIPRGGDNVKVEKGETGGNTLKVVDVNSMRITRLKIEDEGEMKTYESDKGEKPTIKLVIGVSYEGMRDGDPDKWSMNNKSRNALIDIWGDDTKDWIGKWAEITIAGDGEFKHIVVDTLRTK